ncbi:MAG: winged helix-turn-helix transcriptional regulator [Promethearchaeota archaeon]
MSFEKIIRKKGNFIILSKLKYKPLSYNRIKNLVKGYFSARTLDFRLKELTNTGILKSEIIDQPGLLRKNYSLTLKGRLILSCLECIRDIFDEKIPLKDFQKYFLKNLKKNQLYDFSAIWKKFKRLITGDNKIYTLKKNKLNRIIEIDDNKIIVQTEKGIDKISYQQLEEIWHKFVDKEKLFQSDYENSSYRSSFVLSLFSKLPFVKINKETPLSIELELS